MPVGAARDVEQGKEVGGGEGGGRGEPDAGDERADDDSFMIVGFEVLACSIARSPGDPITDTPCADGGGAMPPPQLVAPGARVAYTYDVFWEESAITWATRWDAYLRAPGGAGSVHWLSILNSLAVVLVTSSLVAWIMARTVRRDLARYEAVLGGEGDVREAAGAVVECLEARGLVPRR